MPQTYTGEIRDGGVILDGTSPPLPSGTRVRVQIEPIAPEQTATSDEKVVAGTRELLLKWAKVAEATAPPMPEDLTLEHDHYASDQRRGDTAAEPVESILSAIVRDFAVCMSRADEKRPQSVNLRSKQVFQPGIGPHSEAQTVELVAKELRLLEGELYGNTVSTAVPYPEFPRQKCDLCIGAPPVWEWAIEVKMLRFLGDNGKINDNILMHILSPYSEHRSALTDCAKLNQSRLARRKAIVIYGYEHDDWPLEPAIAAFELLASMTVLVGQRETAWFSRLIHPVHTAGAVYGWEIGPARIRGDQVNRS